MSALTDARNRLANGYYNSNPKSSANPGGLAANGHQTNFPLLCIDLGLVLLQGGADAQALTNALPDIQAGVAARVGAEAARDQAKIYRDQAQEIASFDPSLKANVNSPNFTGAPTAPTPAASENSNRLPTTAWVKALFSGLVGASPATLDTIVELANAINNDPAFSTTISTALTGKVSKTGDTMTAGLAWRIDNAKGWVAVQPSTAATPGYFEFYTADNVRRGYIGTAVGSKIQIVGENGYSWSFYQRPDFAGATPWDTANLSPVDLGSAQVVSGQKAFVGPNVSMSAAVNGQVGLEVRSGGGGAFLGFHRPSVSYGFFGVDSDGQLKFAPSAGAPSVVWHAGNDGAGSGLDADMLRGAVPDAVASGNSIAKRAANGDLNVRALGMTDSAYITGNGGLSWSTWGINLVADNGWIRTGASFVSAATIQGAVVRETSDARLKRNYKPLADAGDLADRIRVYLGEKRIDGEWVQSLYVLAQELREEAPYAVGEGAGVHEDGSPILTVNYGMVGLIALAGLQAERQRTSALEARIERLEHLLGAAGQ